MSPERLSELDEAIAALTPLDLEADEFFGDQAVRDSIHEQARPDDDPPDMKHVNDVFTPPERVDESTGEVLTDGERAVPQTPGPSNPVTAQTATLGSAAAATAHRPVEAPSLPPEETFGNRSYVDRPDDIIEPLSVSHTKRDSIITERFTRLMALHGPGSRWDNLRKIRLSLAKQRARADNSDKKVTEALLDDLAHCDEEYQKFLFEGISEASELEGLRSKLQTIDDMIRRSDALLRLRTAEARLSQ